MTTETCLGDRKQVYIGSAAAGMHALPVIIVHIKPNQYM